MANPYAIKLVKGGESESFVGDATFTDPDNQPGGSGVEGSGEPNGVVTPTALGEQYTDTDIGALYLAVGLTDADWILVAGPADANGVAGVASGPGFAQLQTAGAATVHAEGEEATVRAGTGSGIAALVSNNDTAVVQVGQAGATDKLSFYGVALAAKPVVTGALSTVADAPAKAVLTSLITALAAVGLVTNSTT